MTRLLRFRNEGLTFDVRDEGPLDGEPVVLLHGFPERNTSWRRLAPLLHEHGLRTYAPDQRGYSPGARPKRRRDYAAPHLVSDVVALADAIGSPVHLVGHDWGAAAAWLTAAHHPDSVRTLTAVSVPHPAAFTSALVTSSQPLRSWYMALFQLPLVERLVALESAPVEGLLRRYGWEDDDVARFREEIVEYGALPGGLGWYRALPLAPPTYARAKATVPTTVVWSDQDFAISRAGVEKSEQWVDAPYELVVLHGVTHWVPTQAPEALAEAVLARVRGA